MKFDQEFGTTDLSIKKKKKKNFLAINKSIAIDYTPVYFESL